MNYIERELRKHKPHLTDEEIETVMRNMKWNEGINVYPTHAETVRRDGSVTIKIHKRRK